jgi:diguanylate cyclase (GGDEF)-like protein/PAS domain S-box-containing protein
MNALIDHPELRQIDLTAELPRIAAALVGTSLASFQAAETGKARRSLLESAGIRSVLAIPITVEDKLWGCIDFIDSADTPRKWSWAETDTLETLAGLIGAAITRARYVKELADANMIVQNSPTILYRVRGEPPFPLIYVSHNITKFGHNPGQLINRRDWAERLMDDADGSRLRDAMARTVAKDASGASLEFRLRAGDGSHRWVENRYTPVRDKQGRLVEIEGMIIDITERKVAEEKIAHLARTDALTGLANRATFIERMRQAFSATRRGATPFAVLYLDLDHFKPINDTLGHPVGDKLLREVADRLRDCTRDNDIVARLGGDEFAVLQSDTVEPANAGTLAATIQATLMRPYTIDGNDLHITVSIGICPYDESSESPDAMLSQADLALYRSKEEGRNRYRFHSDDLDHQVLERVALSDDLRRAIDNGELELHYQPQVEIRTNRIVGMEAYVRWHHPERGLLAASAFVPVAEKTGSIIALGQWVLDNVCGQMRAWRDEGVNPPVVTMNLSLPQLKNGAELIKDVRTAIDKWRLEPSDLNFDVTEAMLAQITLMRNDVLSELRRIGVGISIDDFGSEYSSLDYLRTYGVNHLKITSEFMDGAAQDPERAKTVRAIVNFARALDIGVITEGVETEEQLDVSSSTSIIAQGFYFSGAIDAGQAEAMLRHGSIDPAGGDRAGGDTGRQIHDEPTSGRRAASSRRRPK